jgi:FkbM family methyltransferase
MIQHHDVWLPDGEKHLQTQIDKGPVVNGGGTYQHHKLELALLYTKQFRLAIDIGGHVGLWARVLAIHFERVEVFEPLPTHRACFVRNVTAENVVLHSCALGAAAGEVRIVTDAAHSMASHVAENGQNAVPMRTLDNFGFEDVDFIKIDVEGYEREVLYGAVDTLKRCKPTLIVEQKPNNARRYGDGDHSALRFLEGLGAKVVAEKAGDYVLVWN